MGKTSTTNEDGADGQDWYDDSSVLVAYIAPKSVKSHDPVVKYADEKLDLVRTEQAFSRPADQNGIRTLVPKDLDEMFSCGRCFQTSTSRRELSEHSTCCKRKKAIHDKLIRKRVRQSIKDNTLSDNHKYPKSQSDTAIEHNNSRSRKTFWCQRCRCKLVTHTSALAHFKECKWTVGVNRTTILRCHRK